MKIVVIGGTGLIGSRTVERLRKRNHEAIAASPTSGVDAVSGAGLDDAMAGAQVVIDLANSPSFEDGPAMEFFETSSRNLSAAEKRAGVQHHVVLSVVGTDRLLSSGYFRAKMAQENLVEASGIPYTIVRATQFFEFVGRIADEASDGKSVRVSPAQTQLIAADDVADMMTDVALGAPANGMIEIAGPERVGLDDFVGRYLRSGRDPRQVVTDENALYFGLKLDDRSLTPDAEPRIGSIRFDEWLARTPRR